MELIKLKNILFIKVLIGIILEMLKLLLFFILKMIGIINILIKFSEEETFYPPDDKKEKKRC